MNEETFITSDSDSAGPTRMSFQAQENRGIDNLKVLHILATFRALLATAFKYL